VWLDRLTLPVLVLVMGTAVGHEALAGSWLDGWWFGLPALGASWLGVRSSIHARTRRAGVGR
jgi:hypothetical protein